MNEDQKLDEDILHIKKASINNKEFKIQVNRKKKGWQINQ